MAYSNPLYYLISRKKREYHQIPKSLHATDEGNEWELSRLKKKGGVGGEEDVQRKVILKAGTKVMELQHVNPMQWCAVNIRPMMELLMEGSLTVFSIADYLAYTAKVSDGAAVYQLTSLLQYDSRRKMRTKNGFSWGENLFTWVGCV